MLFYATASTVTWWQYRTLSPAMYCIERKPKSWVSYKFHDILYDLKFYCKIAYSKSEPEW